MIYFQAGITIRDQRNASFRGEDIPRIVGQEILRGTTNPAAQWRCQRAYYESSAVQGYRAHITELPV
jgi:hypothetical protein